MARRKRKDLGLGGTLGFLGIFLSDLKTTLFAINLFSGIILIFLGVGGRIFGIQPGLWMVVIGLLLLLDGWAIQNFGDMALDKLNRERTDIGEKSLGKK